MLHTVRYLVWRNIWRNPTRTWGLILGFAVSVAGLLNFGALVRGLNEQRLAERLQTSLGHIKITHPDFFQHKPVEAHFECAATLRQALAGKVAILAYAPRLNVRAATAEGIAVDVYGIDIEAEKHTLSLYKHIKTGQYLQEKRPEVVIGKALAQKIKKKVSDTLILYLPAPLKLCIKGLYDVSSQDFSNTHIFLPDTILRTALGLPSNTFHQILLRISEPNQTAPLAHALRLALPTLRIKTWQETAPDLAYLHTITSYVLGSLVFFVLCLCAVLQYILWRGTWQARATEWSRLRAWGLTKSELWCVWAGESLTLGAIGLGLGLLLGGGILLYLGNVGIDLAYFGEGLAKAGYRQVVFPVLWQQDLVSLLLCMGLLPFVGILAGKGGRKVFHVLPNKSK